MINNDMYGGLIISKNVLNGVPIRYTYREKSTIAQLNGWNSLSAKDDDEYLADPNNFVVVSAQTIFSIAPQMLEIFEAPYGTDLFWIYEKGVHIGFYDLKTEREVDIEDIVK